MYTSLLHLFDLLLGVCLFVCLFFGFCYRCSFVKTSDKRILLCFGLVKLVHLKTRGAYH